MYPKLQPDIECEELGFFGYAAADDDQWSYRWARSRSRVASTGRKGRPRIQERRVMRPK
jgi:hypothetical protein